MIEYIYDAIKATAGEDIVVNARITEENGKLVTSNCFLSLLDDENELMRVEGIYAAETWKFIIPALKTAGLRGRFWYSIRCSNSSLSFKQPLYLV